MSERLRLLRYPFLLALLSTAITFAFAFCAFVLAERAMPPRAYSEIWTRWDAVNYIAIAQHGYAQPASGEQRLLIVFYPLYPLAIRIAHVVVRSWPIAALLVANVCCVAAFVYFFLLCQFERNKAFARRAVLFLAVFPTAYFLHASYSESMFLACAIGSFYYARRGNWFACGLLGMLATGTRVFGVTIAPALAFEYLQQKNFRWREIRWDCMFLGLGPLGFLAYLAINKHYFGDAFQFLSIEREHWSAFLRWPWPAVESNLYGVTHADAVGRVIQHGAQLIAIAFATFAVIVAVFRLRPCYTIYLAIGWVLIFSNNFPLSSPRYLLCEFPLFMLLAEWCRRLWLRDAITFACVLFYAAFTTLFVRGWFAF